MKLFRSLRGVYILACTSVVVRGGWVPGAICHGKLEWDLLLKQVLWLLLTSALPQKYAIDTRLNYCKASWGSSLRRCHHQFCLLQRRAGKSISLGHRPHPMPRHHPIPVVPVISSGPS